LAAAVTPMNANREAAAGEPRFQARDAFAKPVSRRPLVLYPIRHR